MPLQRRTVAALVALLGVSTFSFPFVYSRVASRGPPVDANGPLDPSLLRRGAYVNTGSRDIGRDPDWNAQSGRYEPQRRRQQGEQAEREHH